jgi:hypothetical protein
MPTANTIAEAPTFGAAFIEGAKVDAAIPS